MTVPAGVDGIAMYFLELDQVSRKVNAAAAYRAAVAYDVINHAGITGGVQIAGPDTSRRSGRGESTELSFLTVAWRMD